ncbi:lysozyme [Mesorhizobium intechi]|uniref:lysozyme n=1 Tax=Mesorhizobium intechi TaxID=537601 RepID=UPI000CC97430|nr:lysozyme [Mesorhizobium intechi]TSE14053.1 lysozyme [Mesorhizobium intechi]
MAYAAQTAVFAALTFFATPILADDFPSVPDHVTSPFQLELLDNPSLGFGDAGSARKIPPLALDLIKDFERWMPDAYNDSSNYCTIGYGHLIDRQPCAKVTEKVAAFKPPLSVEEGLKMLDDDTSKARIAVSKLVQARLTDEQFGAVVSFVFNVGASDKGFKGSKMRRLLNAEEYNRAALEFPKWVKSKGNVVDGLINRRSCELDLYKDKLTSPFNRRDCAPLGASPPSEELINIETGTPDK